MRFLSAVLNRLEQLAGVTTPQSAGQRDPITSTKGLVLPRKTFPTAFDGEGSAAHTPLGRTQGPSRANSGATVVAKTSLAEPHEGVKASTTASNRLKRAALWGDLPIMPGAPSDDGSDLLDELARPSPSPPAVNRLIASLGEGAEQTVDGGRGGRPQKQLREFGKHAKQAKDSEHVEESVDAFMAVADLESQESEDELELGFPLEMMADATEPINDDSAQGARRKDEARPKVESGPQERRATLTGRSQGHHVQQQASVPPGVRKQQSLFLRTSPPRRSSPSIDPLFQDFGMDAHLHSVEGAKAMEEEDDAVEDLEGLLEDEEHLEAWLLAHTRDEE